MYWSSYSLIDLLRNHIKVNFVLHDNILGYNYTLRISQLSFIFFKEVIINHLIALYKNKIWFLIAKCIF